MVVCGVDVTNGSAMRRSVSLIILFGKAAILAVNLNLFGLARRGSTELFPIGSMQVWWG